MLEVEETVIVEEGTVLRGTGYRELDGIDTKIPCIGRAIKGGVRDGEADGTFVLDTDLVSTPKLLFAPTLLFAAPLLFAATLLFETKRRNNLVKTTKYHISSKAARAKQADFA